jgi:hypothetical protein
LQNQIEIMHMPKFAALLLSLGLVPSALAAPTASDPAVGVGVKALIFDGPHPINTTAAADRRPDDAGEGEMSAAANCWGGSDINTNDIQGLADGLQKMSGNQYLPAHSWFSYSFGSAKVRVLNNYLFENTHVAYFEAG